MDALPMLYGLWLRLVVGGGADDGLLPLRGSCGCAAA